MGHLTAILNEALANVCRHAKAHSVRILAQDGGEILKIVIEDDGIGIAADAPGGYGLRNMRDRARMLDGKLDLQGRRGQGTKVTVEIPWSD
jgi:signal transduction histidine kinase